MLLKGAHEERATQWKLWIMLSCAGAFHQRVIGNVNGFISGGSCFEA